MGRVFSLRAVAAVSTPTPRLRASPYPVGAPPVGALCPKAMPPDTAPTIAVIVPTFNERGNPGPLVDQVTAALDGASFRIVFADDSTDETTGEIEDLARANPAVSLNHSPTRRGLARAVVDALDGLSEDTVVVMDGDLQHPPRDRAGPDRRAGRRRRHRRGQPLHARRTRTGAERPVPAAGQPRIVARRPRRAAARPPDLRTRSAVSSPSAAPSSTAQPCNGGVQNPAGSPGAG